MTTNEQVIRPECCCDMHADEDELMAECCALHGPEGEYERQFPPEMTESDR